MCAFEPHHLVESPSQWQGPVALWDSVLSSVERIPLTACLFHTTP